MVSIFLEITEPQSLSYTRRVIQEYDNSIPTKNNLKKMVKYSM